MLFKPDFCKNCIGYKWSCQEYVPASGSGENGVLVVAEAAGEHETQEDMPLVGKAGYFLFQNLARVGIERDGFRIHNVLSCRPPQNKLAKEPYEEAVIAYCSPLLDATIMDMRERCAKSGKTFVIVTLGRIAFKRIMGLTEKSPILRQDYLCYPFWSDKYHAFVLASDHPSFLMRGNNHLVPVLQFVFKRALEIAENGLILDTPEYLLDPEPSTFQQWVADYEHAWQEDQSIALSYDIETPYKQGMGEDELAKEDEEDYNIIRCSFAYVPNQAVSVPWRAEWIPYIEELFSSPGIKVGWNSANYDDPRIMAKMPIHGDRLDAMQMWHVLNSALDKSLGSVTPYYVYTTSLWKHLADAQPAFYNAKDADMALRDYIGIRKDLVKNNQWQVFEKHVVRLNRALNYMSEKGVLRDEVMRAEAEKKLQDLLDVTEIKMEAAVPKEARRVKIYKKLPKDTTGMEAMEQPVSVRTCLSCGELRPRKNHSRFCSNINVGKYDIPSIVWAKPLDFKVSKVGLTSYQKALKHLAVVDRRNNKTTFDENAIEQLIKRYPNDPLYPQILEHRKYSKLLGTYVGITQEDGKIHGGMPIGKDNRIHGQYTHNPSTLRLAMQNPSLQVLPRSGGGELSDIIRNLIVATDGCVLLELDYAAIEAVLTGYFCGSPEYIRLAKLGIHAYLTSHVVGKPADLNWSDTDLRHYFGQLKSQYKREYNASKRMVHGSNYGMTPKKMVMTESETFGSLAEATRIQKIYLELFPALAKWQLNIQLQADKDGFLRNPYGYIHRFYRVFSWKRECGKWIRSLGDDANKVLAFLPQSTAAGIIKEAMLNLYYEHFFEAGQYLRLQVHDSLVSEVPKTLLESVLEIKKRVMTKPVTELRLPISYGLGEYLTIDVDCKSGTRWGGLH